MQIGSTRRPTTIGQVFLEASYQSTGDMGFQKIYLVN